MPMPGIPTMRALIRSLPATLVLALAFAAPGALPGMPGLGATAALAQGQGQKAYVREDLASEGVRLEEQLRKEAAGLAGRPAAQLRAEGQAAAGRGDYRRGLALIAGAITAEPRDPANWLALSRVAFAANAQNGGERWQLQQRAAAGAYVAYQRATTRPDEAAALAQLGDTFAARSIWRPALDAYRQSLALADNAAVRNTYTALREQHGFRITDYKVDSDSASPRVCFQFSDPLARGKVDFAPYVAVAGSANAAVAAEEQQLCVDGLKHGERYAVVLRQGLPSAVGENLLKNADYDIYVRDRSPQVRFTGRNYVLPRVGQEGIPLVSVNTAKVDVEISRIGDRNLLPTVRSEDFLAQLEAYRAREIGNEKGFRVWSGTMDTRSELNRDVVTAFPVLEAVGTLQPGVYVMTAKPNDGKAPAAATSADDTGYNGDDWRARATQWFVVSDLGLTSFVGDDGVHVFVRSLASAQPMPDVEIRLIARNNEVLATKQTDATGHVAFDPGLARGTAGMAPSLAVASVAGDYGFLDLGQAAFDLTDRGVKGRVAPKGLDAFLYAERGVYRTGETVFVTALLRDAAGVAVPGIPLTLVAKRPDGVEYRRASVPDQGQGGRAYSLPLLAGAAHGTWRVLAYADPKGPSIGEATFLVEDYVPERLAIELTPKQKTLGPGEPAQIDVLANFLYGAPGANLEVTGEYVIEKANGPTVPGLEGYAVGLADESFEASSGSLEEAVTTDARGRASVTMDLPEVAAAQPVQARISLSVGEPGGRAIMRSVTLPIRPRGPVVAVRKLFGEDIAEGGQAQFDVVYAAPDGTRLARPGLRWTLSRIEKRYQWFQQDGRWSFEPIVTTRRVSDGTVDAGVGGPARIASVAQTGSYRLDVTGGGDGDATSVDYTVGWSGDATAQTPDLLELSLDKAAYAAGDSLQLTLTPRFDGQATVAVVSDKVQLVRTVPVKAGENRVSIPVEGGWGAGAYVVAFAHRPLEAAAKRMPGRAMGVAWFAVDKAARTLAVSLDPQKKIRPRGKLDIPLRLAGLSPGEEAFVTVAAVDVGILSLTGYELPDPAAHFFGQRQLPLEVRDLYGYLIDGMQGTRGAIRSGGDGAGLSADVSPPTQEPLARYSGVVKVGPDGTATVSFDLPAFNGTVKVMAVAWSKGRAGSAETEVIVRDPVVVTGTLPRFMNLGDQSRFHMEVDNVEGPAGTYTVDLDVTGPVVLPASATRSTVQVAANARTSLTIPVTAAGIGAAAFDLRLTGPGVDAAQSFRLRVNPGSSTIYRRIVRPLPPGGGLTITDDLVSEFLPGTGAVSLAVSAHGGIDVPALLQALDRYPYGCTEQVVSRAMPLLYVNRLAATQALALDDGVDQRIRDAIDRVLSRQDSNGAFGLWSVGGAEDIWLDAFVTDFLTRARERNFAVPQRAIEISLDRLRNTVANTTDVSEGEASGLAYAIYVLARNGRPVMGDLRYLSDTKLAQFQTPLARAQIAAALALLGDRGRAQTAFGSALERLRAYRDGPVSRADYGSRLRDGAGVLALVAEANQGRDLVQRAGAVVEEARGAATYTSTQENAWMVLAASALSREGETLGVTLDGVRQPGAVFRTLRGAALEGRPLVLGNEGQAPVQVVLTLSGQPVAREPAASQGYTVERSFYRIDGTKVDAASVRQNDRLVVVLKVTEPEAKFARLLLVDPLPAGLEIDNPRLVTGDTLSGLSWLTQDIEPVATEYRDDRFVAAIDRRKGQPAFFTLAYTVRAVSPGRYVHPPAVVEDMYRPERFGRTGYGTVEVTSAR
ncbi:MAG: MG2 domain-containing protein [Burkholderiales bacterium]|nr:MG2 domain-containing protein [Burkholderiales bacterium]